MFGTLVTQYHSYKANCMKLCFHRYSWKCRKQNSKGVMKHHVKNVQTVKKCTTTHNQNITPNALKHHRWMLTNSKSVSEGDAFLPGFQRQTACWKTITYVQSEEAEQRKRIFALS